MPLLARRSDFLFHALECMGTPYLWCGKDPKAGLDCSGLVTWSLWRAGGPDWRATHNTDRFLELPEVQPGTLLPGDLVLYGPSRSDANHVVLWIGGNEVVVGACGGDSHTTSVEIAKAQSAKVKPKTSYLYRPDLIGFRRLPLI